MINMGKQILIIDDDRIIQVLLSRIFLRHGFQILTATSAQEGIEKLRNNTIDLITCDLMMPEISGLEFLQLTNGNPDWVSIPVIVISAAGHPAEVGKAIALGARAVIHKPFKPEDVEDIIRNYLSD